jgi:ribosomal-protein-serine acetyltransferase
VDDAVRIRRYRADDAPALFEAAVESTADVFPWLPWCHPAYTLDESRAWIAHCDAAWEAGIEYQFAIVDSTDRVLGGCGLNQLQPDHRVANLGYWVRTSATRHGVATAGARALARFAFRETSLARLEIVVAVDNVASHRVALNVGAIAEGVAHDRLYLHGRSHDARVYALLRSRYHDDRLTPRGEPDTMTDRER